jgi:hypothetical protein
VERLSALWWLLPQEALPLVIVVGGLAVMFRIASVRSVLGAVIGFALLPVLSPVIEALFRALPAWVSLLLFVGIGFSCLQAIATAVIGRRATAHMVGSLAADFVRFLLKVAFLPVRLVWRVIAR